MPLFEFTAILRCAAVVKADTEAEARAEIETWERSWVDVGELQEASDVELVDVRDGDSDDAHISV